MRHYHNQYIRRKCFSTLIIALLFNIIVSAKGGIKGIVTSVAGEKLAGASVFTSTNQGTSTNEIGQYELELPAGKYHLTISLISFEKYSTTVIVQDTGYFVLNVRLSEQVRSLNVVVVSAGKFEQKLEDITVSMEVIKPSLVEARNTTQLDEVMDMVPGVNIIDGQANIRGGSGWSYGAGSRVQILVDDLPQLTADANDTKWSFLPIENLEQIEVIKGASSVLFGSSALNGVINVRTAYPRDTALTKITYFTGVYDKASFSIHDTSYDLTSPASPKYFNTGMNFLHSQKIGQLDLVAGGNMFYDQGYREGENEQRARFNLGTRYRFKNIQGLSVGINVNHMQTNGSLFFLWKNDTSGAYIPAPNTLSGYTTYRTNIDPNATYVGQKGSTHKIRTRWFNTTNENNTSQNSKADLIYTEYQYQKRIKEAYTFSGGLVRILSKVKSQLYGDHDGEQIAAYVQSDIKIKRISFSAGARIERNRVDSVKDSPTPVFRGGVNYHPFGETYFRASAGQGYRFPAIAEKFILTNIGSIYIYPNRDLNPEKGVSLEIGVKQGIKIGRWAAYFDAAVFRNEYKNMIEFVFGQWAPPTNPLFGNGFTSRNIGNIRIQGLELSLMGSGKIAGDVNLNVLFGYTYLSPRQLTYDSLYIKVVGTDNYRGSDSTDFLKYRFRHMLKGDVELSYHRLAFGVSYRYTSRMENIDKIFVSGLLDFAFRPGLGIGHYRQYHRHGDQIVDIRTSYRVAKNLTAAFIVKNLFNYIYMQRPADMQPPRTFVGQLSLAF